MSAVSNVSIPVPGKDFEDQRSSKPQQWITRDEMIELSRIKHWRVIGHVALTWGMIVLALQLAIVAIDRLPLWAGILAGVGAFVFIGCQQNALISWTHEASHYSLTRSKKLNDRLADLFIAGPAGATVAGYRQHHVLHHRYLGDPEKEIALEVWLCLKGGYLWSAILRYMLGINAFRVIFRYFGQNPPQGKPDGQPARSIESLVGFAVTNGLLFAVCAVCAARLLVLVLPAVGGTAVHGRAAGEQLPHHRRTSAEQRRV
jgi:fatty acid desaturase